MPPSGARRALGKWCVEASGSQSLAEFGDGLYIFLGDHSGLAMVTNAALHPTPSCNAELPEASRFRGTVFNARAADLRADRPASRQGYRLTRTPGRRAADRASGRRLHISSQSELRAYVIKTTLLCTIAALSLDIVNQLVFFEDWSVAIRSWLVTIAISSLIAAPVTRAIGKANLELFRAKEIVEKLSRTDPLTGLLNRRALLEPTGSEAAVMALVIVDIDRFKRVNDTHGHMAGDEVIRVVARLIQKALEDFGRVGRLGGEEFALVSDSLDVVALASRLDALLNTIEATPIVFSGQTVFVTVSAGWALRRSDQGFAELYAEADRALYLAKAQGRNAVVAAERI